MGGWCWDGAWWDSGMVGWWAETPSASPRLDDEERKGRARQHSRALALPWAPHGFLLMKNEEVSPGRQIHLYVKH